MSMLRRSILAGVATLGAFAGGLVFAGPPALAAAPEVQGESVPDVTPFEARLEAVVNAGEESTECHFQYGKTTVSEHEVLCEQGALGGGEQGVGVTVTSLQPETTYHYRVVVKNATSEVKGTEEAFTTLTLEKPVVEGESVSGVTSSAGTLEAQVNPNYQSTTYSFEYATNKALTGATTVKGAAALEGFGAQTAGVPTGAPLQAGEVYYYRVVAENATGTTDGTVQYFATVPAPHTEPVTEIGASTATLNGHLGPLNLLVATQYYFDYSLLPSKCTEGSATPSGEAGSGPGTEVAEATEVSGLQPLEQYTACFVTANAFGSQVGSEEHFTTLAAPPTIDSQSVSGVTSTDASLEAKINPNNQETATYFFEYGSSEAALGEGKGTKLPDAPPAPAFPAVYQEEQAGPVDIGGGLTPGATYYYRVIAENSAHEKTEGPIEPFATLPVLASVGAGEANSITRTSAVLMGTVNPGGAEATYRFVYVDAAEYEPGATNPYARGASTSESSVSSDYTVHAVGPLEVSGLDPGVTYDYAIVATNLAGTKIGPNGAFTTSPPTPPIALTGEVTGLTQSTATITATLDARGLPTRWELQLGSTPGSLEFQAAGDTEGSGAEPLALNVGSLSAGTVYHYKLIAVNSDGAVESAESSFTTAAAANVAGSLTQSSGTPLFSIPNSFPNEEAGSSTTIVPKALTRAQKLKNALKACSKDRSKGKRAACVRQAHKKYGPAKKKKR
jgi:hypothetical protein